jgi:hypothetical protein
MPQNYLSIPSMMLAIAKYSEDRVANNEHKEANAATQKFPNAQEPHATT